MSKKQKGKTIHRAKPKTWNPSKQRGSRKIKLGAMPPERRQRIIERLSEATGWGEKWFADKEEGLLLRLANKYI